MKTGMRICEDWSEDTEVRICEDWSEDYVKTEVRICEYLSDIM